MITMTVKFEPAHRRPLHSLNVPAHPDAEVYFDPKTDCVTVVWKWARCDGLPDQYQVIRDLFTTRIPLVLHVPGREPERYRVHSFDVSASLSISDRS